eukprot:297942_1
MMKSLFQTTLHKCRPNILPKVRCLATVWHHGASSKEQLEGSVASYYGKNANYAGLFGTNIHFGYFPHISDLSKPIINFPESGAALNQHMIDVAGIDASSSVIDFGCGVGGPIFDVSQLTNCKATGLDLTPEFIETAKQQFGSQSDKVNYVVGSITDLPVELKNGPKFTHLFSIQAICHVARFLNDVLREARSVLDTNGVVIINDFVVAENGPTEKAQAHFYKRLHFDHLLTFADYAEGLTNNGFDIIKYENCSKHAKYGYEILAPQAKEAGSIEADGLPLYKHYQETSACFDRGELGMVVIVARKR